MTHYSDEDVALNRKRAVHVLRTADESLRTKRVLYRRRRGAAEPHQFCAVGLIADELGLPQRYWAVEEALRRSVNDIFRRNDQVTGQDRHFAESWATIADDLAREWGLE